MKFGSTQDYIKENGKLKNGIVVIAESQTSGRGTKR